MERLLPPLGAREETLGVGRLQRYLKYKAAVKGGGRSKKRDWDHGVKSGKEREVTWEGGNQPMRRAAVTGR